MPLPSRGAHLGDLRLQLILLAALGRVRRFVGQEALVALIHELVLEQVRELLDLRLAC